MGSVLGNTLRRLATPKGSPAPVGTVVRTTEFRRIAALPRRVLDLSQVEDVTPLLRKPGGTMTLFPVQSAALIEMAIMDGLVGPIAVGHGKELICLLAPVAMDSTKCVLLIPSSLRDQVMRDMRRYGEHFVIPVERITIVTYHALQQAKNTDLLERLKPDLIVANECHHVGNPSARTKRLKRYLKAHPECRYVPVSGTMASRKFAPQAFHSEHALHKNSPCPGNWQEIQDWAGALDVKPEYVMKPGALTDFCRSGESTRDGYGRRFTETPGVVIVQNAELKVALNIRRIGCKIPLAVKTELDKVRKDWQIGDDALADAARRAEVLREVACGFYYKWRWPGGEPDWEWLSARSAWKGALRDKLARAREGMDSELLLYRAAERWWNAKAKGINPVGLVWECPEWIDWHAVEDRPEPPKETIWLDDYLCRDALERAESYLKKGRRPIIWTEHVATLQKLGELSGIRTYGPGTDAGIATEKILIASRRSQGTGKNLQDRYDTSIFFLFPGGQDAEQTIGRTHREPGQEADEVWVDWYGHTSELEMLMDKAKREAEYDQSMSKKPQRILYATHVNESETRERE